MTEDWSIEKARETYGIQQWGGGYFDVCAKGEVRVQPFGPDDSRKVSLLEIVEGLRDRGLFMPVLLRFADILDARMRLLYESFEQAITNLNYGGEYRGVYPIKVNQQQQVVEEIVEFGQAFHHGLEAGSKAELIAALACMKDPEAFIICNGYKDEEFVDLALYAQKMGYRPYLVLEMLSELELILERSRKLGIRPLLGVRAKLAAKAESYWSQSSGDRSMFGLTASQIVDVVDRLKEVDMLDCLKLLHYHVGSQIPNIRSIRLAATEAMRIYVNLVEEGAPMGVVDVGGGLAVDYDGTHTNTANSCNYGLQEYATDIVEVIMQVSAGAEVPPPTIVSESGRAMVAHHSVLLFNILDVTRFESHELPDSLDDEAPEPIRNLLEVRRVLTRENLQECYNDVLYYRDDVRARFDHGGLSLRERALGERIAWAVLQRIAVFAKQEERVSEALENLAAETADVYHGNFSVFQSLPDAWAIDQMFPVMPLHRLEQAPTRQGMLADITCDCDGRLDKFMESHETKNTLPLHELNGKDYYLGVFLVGAYQETLGDLHNLLGDTNVVSVRVGKDGAIEYVKEIEGDTVADVLSYVEYRPEQLIDNMKKLAEQAVRSGQITPGERREILTAFQDGLRGYTYFES